MTNWNQTWTPKTDKEIDVEIERAKANHKSEPRQYSRVKLTGDSWFRQEILDDTDSDINDYNALIYLGSIPNQPGHSVYFNLKYNYIDSIHTDELEEVPEDEL